MCAHDDSNKASAERETPYFGDVCLLGLGVTGRAVVDYFLSCPECLNSLTIYTGEAEQQNLTYLASLPEHIVVHSGEQLVSGHYDVAVVSPGIPPHSSLYTSAAKASREVISEPELAWRISPENWVAVTGTNGKTTVTELITWLLRSAGKSAWSAGNIGIPCIEIVRTRQPGDWLVAELSSYQLHSTINFAPDVAVLLNITPDHLSWHGSHESYTADKKKLLANLAAGKPAILDVCLPETHAIAQDFCMQGRRVIHIGSPDGLSLINPERKSDIAYVDAEQGTLVLRLHSGNLSLLNKNELRIKGAHNLSNALAAAAVAAELGATADDIDAGLRSFAPLPHRFEPCGDVAGVSFINDSKATNIDAAIKAVSAFTDDARVGSVIALFGGLDKGTNLDSLVSACQGPCKYAVCYGEAGMRFRAALGARFPAMYEPTFDEAFYRAFILAEPGDTVLLSPACASFDEFDSFEARGERFKANVEKLRGAHS